MAASDHLGGQFTIPASKPSCATCGKKRKLVTFSSLDKWAGEPDQCMGCGSGVQHWATPAKSSGPSPAINDDDWTMPQ